MKFIKNENNRKNEQLADVLKKENINKKENKIIHRKNIILLNYVSINIYII